MFHYFGNAVFGYTNTPSLWIWLNTLYENAAQAGPEQGNTADDELGRWVPLLILVGDVWGQERAMMIETKFGFATFLFALGSLFALGALLNENRKPRSQSQQAPEPISPPTAP